MCFLTLGALIGHKFVLDKLPEDLVAATVFKAGNGSDKTHWNNLMVLHPHLDLCDGEIHMNMIMRAEKRAVKVPHELQSWKTCRHK